MVNCKGNGVCVCMLCFMPDTVKFTCLYCKRKLNVRESMRGSKQASISYRYHGFSFSLYIHMVCRCLPNCNTYSMIIIGNGSGNAMDQLAWKHRKSKCNSWNYFKSCTNTDKLSICTITHIMFMKTFHRIRISQYFNFYSLYFSLTLFAQASAHIFLTNAENLNRVSTAYTRWNQA